MPGRGGEQFFPGPILTDMSAAFGTMSAAVERLTNPGGVTDARKASKAAFMEIERLFPDNTEATWRAGLISLFDAWAARLRAAGHRPGDES